MSQISSGAVLRTKPMSEQEVAAAMKEIAAVPLSDHDRTLMGVLLAGRSEELCDPVALRSQLASIAAELTRALGLWNSGDKRKCQQEVSECQSKIFDLLPADPKDPLFCHAFLSNLIESELEAKGLTFDAHKAAISRMVAAIDVPNPGAESDPRLQELTHIRRVVLQDAFEKLTEFENEADGSTEKANAARHLQAAIAALKGKANKSG